MALLSVTEQDKKVYEELRDFLPDTFVDCHTHIWLKSHEIEGAEHSFSWPDMVAEENSMEDLLETNATLFPDKKVISVLYGQPMNYIDLEENNNYVAQWAEKLGCPALYLTHPGESDESIEAHIAAHPCFKGLKVYLEFSPAYIPANEIRIYDFLPPRQLALADKHGWVVQLHIARPKRLADPVNYVQLKEIEDNYPNLQLIVAHLGRAYAKEDIGDALEYLKDTKKTMWDFTANTNQYVMEQVLQYFGPDRLMYGSDFPIFRMKARRTVEDGYYINEIPADSLGDVSSDGHMREIPYPEAEEISFFIYEEMLSAKRACENLGYGKEEVEKIFCKNAMRIFGME
ncbi:MAG: amidohydrolase [Oscillospiraceae bacterium]|nr:amidohydrolase [Oscillospiraceae bacterium]